MLGSSVSFGAVLLAVSTLTFAVLAIGAVAAWRRQRDKTASPVHDPLEELFKGDNLARAVAALMARHNQPVPHALMAALRKVWHEEAAAQAEQAGIAGRGRQAALPAPSPGPERKNA